MVKFVYTLLLIVIEWYTVKEKKTKQESPPPKPPPPKQTNTNDVLKRVFEIFKIMRESPVLFWEKDLDHRIKIGVYIMCIYVSVLIKNWLFQNK